MQYDKIKKDLPTHLVCGHLKNIPALQKVLVNLEGEKLEDLVNRNTEWGSLTIFELPSIPIIDMDRDELFKHRLVFSAQEKEKREYEYYLKLKAKFEPE